MQVIVHLKSGEEIKSNSKDLNAEQVEEFHRFMMDHLAQEHTVLQVEDRNRLIYLAANNVDYVELVQ